MTRPLDEPSASAPARYNAGQVPFGHVETGDEISYVARSGPAVFHGLITGGEGSGMSTAVRAVTTALDASGEWSTSTVSCGGRDAPEQALDLLDQLEDRVQARRGGGLFRLLALDGFHRLVWDDRLAAHGFVARIERLAEVGPRHGVALLIATESLLVSDFGNSTKLRARLAMHNLFALRSHNPSDRIPFEGVLLQPNRLPGGGGHAYTVLGGELVQLRIDWPGGEHDDQARHFNGALRSQRGPRRSVLR